MTGYVSVGVNANEVRVHVYDDATPILSFTADGGWVNVTLDESDPVSALRVVAQLETAAAAFVAAARARLTAVPA